ncbi:hypothetical protein PITC_028250 [Penicillium italicum]|uniref:Uncharacterized protein n=1 Tax=Penicillium italicum TaxID=40296 RepID=A0A0A2KVG9_PENIT|nr:hypothetical protein PITC_028250 [Penicillium italicum]
MVPTDFVHRPRGQLTGKLQRSTWGLTGRLAAMWDNSKCRYQQSTTETWHKSADQLHRVARIEDTTQHVKARYKQTQQQTQEQTTPQSRFYSQVLSSKSTNSSPNPKTTSHSIKVKSTISTSVTGGSNSPEAQIRGFYEETVLVNSMVKQTKQLRDDKRAVLGEIELEWVNSTITDAENAANDLAAFVKQAKNVSSKDRSSWKRRDYEVALKKKSRMLLSHGKVETVLNHLSSLPSILGGDKAFFSPSKVLTVASEPPCATNVISVFELPCLSPVKAERPIPKIVVTQHDGPYDGSGIYSHTDETHSPSYEASEMNRTAELW